MTTEINMTARVSEVMVYPEQAKVTLKSEQELNEGLMVLVFDDLPLALIADSIRFSGSGNAPVRVRGVDLRKVHHERTPAVKVAELEQQIEEQQDNLRGLVDERSVLEEQRKYLASLRAQTEQYARGLALGRTKVGDQTELAQSFKDQDLEVRQGIRELEMRERELSRLIDRFKRELNDLISERPKDRNQVRVEVEVQTPGLFVAELSYLVQGARWQPIYDIRLIEEKDEQEIELTILAQISQTTGQNWLGVAIGLSTARTSLTQRLPDLKPWFIDEYREVIPEFRAAKRPPEMQAVAAAPMPAPSMAPIPAPPRAMRMEEEMAEVVSESTQEIISFRVTGKVDIPSDGSPHKTTVSRIKLPAKIDYLAVPRYSDAVHRRVTAVNRSSVPLMAGNANLFVEDEYIGSLRLDYLAKDDELELVLGVEERITIERKLARREVDKARLRDKRQLIYGYEIVLNNLLPHEIKVEIQENIPVSRHEDIKVKVIEFQPGPKEQTELNIITWEQVLAGGVQKTIHYTYQVEHPRTMRIRGLVD